MVFDHKTRKLSSRSDQNTIQNVSLSECSEKAKVALVTAPTGSGKTDEALLIAIMKKRGLEFQFVEDSQPSGSDDNVRARRPLLDPVRGKLPPPAK